MNPTTPPRPKRSDDAIIDAAARALAKDLSGLLGDPEECLDDLRRVLDDNSHNPDGYRLAKDLDNHFGWDIDAQTVEDLDAAISHIHLAHELACEEWVKTHNLQAPPIGAHVHQIGKEEKNGIGTIVRNQNDGRSTVCFPLLGHTTEGNGTRGYVLPWEEITILHQP
jgi:hypothetical protein